MPDGRSRLPSYRKESLFAESWLHGFGEYPGTEGWLTVILRRATKSPHTLTALPALLRALGSAARSASMTDMQANLAVRLDGLIRKYLCK